MIFGLEKSLALASFACAIKRRRLLFHKVRDYFYRRIGVVFEVGNAEQANRHYRMNDVSDI